MYRWFSNMPLALHLLLPGSDWGFPRFCIGSFSALEFKIKYHLLLRTLPDPHLHKITHPSLTPDALETLCSITLPSCWNSTSFVKIIYVFITRYPQYWNMGSYGQGSFFFFFWLCWGLHCCAWAFSSCGKQGLLFIVVRGLLIAVASLVVEHGL